MKKSKNKIDEAQIYISDKKDIASIKSQLGPEDKLFVMGSKKGEIGESADDSNEETPMIVKHVSDIEGEKPFKIGDTKWEYVKAKYPNGKIGIGVYRFDHDLVYGYKWFKDNILSRGDKVFSDNHQGMKSEIGEEYNIFAICTDSIAKTAGTRKRSKWSDEAKERYERCIKDLKGKKGYKLGEATNDANTDLTSSDDPYGIKGRDMEALKHDVEALFKRLDFAPIEMALKKINTPIEQLEVIATFAEKIGVPRAKLGSLVANLKDIAYQKEGIRESVKETEFTTEHRKGLKESKNPKMTKGALIEHIRNIKNNKKLYYNGRR